LAAPSGPPNNQMTNKSMVIDSANNFSHHNSVGKNYDNSFLSGGIIASAKGN
jgi:hypothetical protein